MPFYHLSSVNIPLDYLGRLQAILEPFLALLDKVSSDLLSFIGTLYHSNLFCHVQLYDVVNFVVATSSCLLHKIVKQKILILLCCCNYGAVFLVVLSYFFGKFFLKVKRGLKAQKKQSYDCFFLILILVGINSHAKNI